MRTLIRTLALLVLVLGVACTAEEAPAPTPTDPPLSTWVDDWRDQVLYQLVTDRFANGDPDNDGDSDAADPEARHGGDFAGILQRLDYLEALGVTGIWISPVVKNTARGYHGYWAEDLETTDPHFGSPEELRALVDAAHARGIAVILDVVVNHLGPVFFYDLDGDGVEDPGEREPPYDPAGVRGADGALAPLLFFDAPAIRPALFAEPAAYHRRGVVTDWGNATQVELGDFPRGGLRDLDTSSPAVRAELVRVLGDWIERTDVDGFRLDTLKHVEHDFWREFSPAIRARARALGKERFFLFGEAFDGNYDVLGAYTRSFETDGVVDFALKFGAFDEVFRGGAGTRRLEELWATKEARVESLLTPGGVGAPPRRTLVNFVDNHDVPRFLAQPGVTPAALRSALAYLFTYDGIPCLYYGTEQELAGGADPANREDLDATGYATDGETFRFVSQLARLRRTHEPLRRGETRFVWTSDRRGGEPDAGIVAFERYTDAERVLVVINVSDAGVSETAAGAEGPAMRVGFPAGTRLYNVLDEPDPVDVFDVAADGTLRVRVPARGAKVLVAGR